MVNKVSGMVTADWLNDVITVNRDGFIEDSPKSGLKVCYYIIYINIDIWHAHSSLTFLFN